jgi:hypothetical protein
MQSTTTKRAVVIADCTDLDMNEEQLTLAANSLAPRGPPVRIHRVFPLVTSVATRDLPETGPLRTCLPTWSTFRGRVAPVLGPISTPVMPLSARDSDYAAGRTLVADQHAGRIPVQIEGRSAVLAMVTIANTDAGVAMQAPPNPGPGSSRAITGLPALARLAPRPLFLDLADQVSTHVREDMIKVALVGGCHEVRPSR